MRFAMGILGGAVSGLITLACTMAALAIGGHSASGPVTLVASLIVGRRVDGFASVLIGIAAVLFLCGLLGGLFTSGVCGRIATGPAIGVGLTYGLTIWLGIRFVVLPLFPETAAVRISSQSLMLASFLFGAMMGLWVIAAAHIWPRLAIRCE